MSVRDVLGALNELTASQWGLATTAQASRRGVSRLQLSRLVADGLLNRLGQGVYRATSVPVVRFDGIKAAWLSIDPRLTAEERLRRAAADAVVSGTTAAWLHGLGGLVPEPYEFTVPERRQTQRRELRFRVRQLPLDSVTIREGLPVTTVEQTIADLVAAPTDHSLVADVLVDARGLDRLRLANLLDPIAARNGFASGEVFLGDLERLSGPTRRKG